MNDDFDRLAREKAGERQVPFSEADWQAMQQLLAGERKRRGGYWWWATAAAVLLGIGGAMWWLTSADPTTGATAHIGVTAEANASTGSTSDPGTASMPSTEGASSGASQQEKRPAEGSDKGTDRNQRTVNTVRTAPRSSELSSAAATTRSSTVPPEPRPVSAQPGDQMGSSSTNSTVNASVTLAAQGEPQGVANSNASDASDPNSTANASPSSATPTTGQATASATGDSSAVSPTSHTPAASTPDTTATAATPAAPSGHFDELVLSIGALRTRTSYSGGLSEQWAPIISDAWTPSFGLEWMRQYSRFGYGAGLNHSTYSERVLQEEAFNTSTQFNYLHAFIQVDTMVTAVVDTVVMGGQIYYVTDQVPTSVLVLETTVDTVVTSEQTQEAIDHYNRVSYLEVPLLGEVHWGSGRWRLGVQAGPLIGFKTTERGSLPYGAAAGSVDLADQPLREVVFGYTARLYVRWLSGNRFSLGVAPGLRGQLGNAYSEGDLSRTSIGFGGSFQLAYRLR